MKRHFLSAAILLRSLLLTAILAAPWAGAANLKVSIAGDSTVGTYKPGEPIAGWGQMLGLFLNEGILADNQAAGGRSTKTFLGEGRWDKLLAGKPRLVLIQFGHNDSHAKERPESTEAATDFKDYLRQYAETAKAAGVTPVFVTPPHRRTYNGKEPSTELAPYAEAIKTVAAEKGLFCVDLHADTGKLLRELGESGAEPLYCQPSDRTHFSPAGAYRMASLIAASLKANGSPMKTLFRDNPLPLPEAAKPAPKGFKVLPGAAVHVFGVSAKVSMSFAGGSDGVTGAPASWMKENADQRLVVGTQPVTAEWTHCYFAFTPKSSGRVMLIVMGSDKDNYVCYDDFEIAGSALDNGGFEQAGADGRPLHWVPMAKAKYDNSSGQAHGGSAFVKCTANDRYSQNLEVKAGEKVTVSFWIKADGLK